MQVGEEVGCGKGEGLVKRELKHDNMEYTIEYSRKYTEEYTGYVQVNR